MIYISGRLFYNVTEFDQKGLFYMSKKSTNFELLRILLTLFIPVYHWFLYNGIYYVSGEPNAVHSLFWFTGVPFTCLYAFISMSGFFLVKKKFSWNGKKLYSFIALLITLFIFKTVFINALFPGWKMNYYVDTFFLKGAWWYVYPYLLIMVFYPLLNYVIYNISMYLLYFITAILGIWFTINSIQNNTIMFNDCIMFLFIYFVMGCIERRKALNKPVVFYQKYRKHILISIYIIGVVLHTILSLYYNAAMSGANAEAATIIMQKVHGRYNLLGLSGGIILFTLFKDIEIPYAAIIHKISKITLFVFLLHESVMAIFWSFEIKSAEYLTYLPATEFWGWLGLYLILVFVAAAIMYKLYYTLAAPLWNYLINPLSESAFTKKWEQLYSKLDRRKDNV